MSNSAAEEALNVFDLREMAKARLPKWLLEYVDRGTEDEVALRNNRAAFERIKLKTQVLVERLEAQSHALPARGVDSSGRCNVMIVSGELAACATQQISRT